MSDEKLAGVSELARLLRVSKNTAVRYSQRDDFPEPLGRLASGRIWREREVLEWAKRTLPLPAGRPPRQ